VSDPVLEIAEVSKGYGSLRPLRVQQLTVRSAERVALVGFDQPMAEVFVNLVTGAALPDRGEVKVFGRSTTGIVDSAEWLTVVDRFGIISERAVFLEGLTVLQNLAVPFTLEIEPLTGEGTDRAAALAREAEVPEPQWEQRIGGLDAAARARIRFARALALDPAVMLMEHPTAPLDPADVAALGSLVKSVASQRGVSVVALTLDQAFCRALGARVLTLDAATGRLAEGGWFRRLLG
jgi:ABC-type transporter Mla maintaining outer membrane lipid asymmetry ATPase subunit MlaF